MFVTSLGLCLIVVPFELFAIYLKNVRMYEQSLVAKAAAARFKTFA